ncbi:MAG: carotenoid oxygenase family protein [Gammaproteobacteria bacterium]
MTHAYPDNRFLRGNFAPLRLECDAPDLVIEGELPRELDGTLLRNGPNPYYPPRDDYHMFSGDGMVHAFRLRDGRVSYRNRWVRTEKLNREVAAGRALFGTFGNPATSEPEVHGVRYNVANTNVLFHGGRLLALEEFNPPYELDPTTLASCGPCDFAGRLRGPMTAHPKVDALTGALHAFGYCVDGWGSTRMAYHHVDATGALTRTVEFDAPYCAMVHDFIVTERYLVFPIFPLTIAPQRARRGGPLLAWEQDRPSLLGVMPRDGSAADLRWFAGEACCVFHPLNAYDADGVIVADMLRYDAGPGFPHADGRPPDPRQAEARLERWRLDLDGATDTFTTTRLDEQASEFPRLDERYAGRAHRYGYFSTTPGAQGRAAVFDEIARYDFARGAREVYRLPAGDSVSEPVFVPRAADAPEGEGWLLAVAHRAREGRSDLLVLDAAHLTDGPVAQARLETRVPSGFHGNWMPAV